MRRHVSMCGAVATVVLLTACDNNPAIFRHFDLTNSDQAIVTDAKQRIFTRTKADTDQGNSNRVKVDIVTCSEPSPDVAQAISTSISAAIAATLKSGDAVNASVAHSSAESIAQLGERIATIQLLRDELADLCRSYANGAVTATTYTLRLSKLDRKMVTLLIGEMTAGAFGRSLANISGSAGSESGKVDEAKVQEAQENVKKAQTEVENNRTALNEIKPEDDTDGKKRAEAQKNLNESTKALHAALQVELAVRRGQLATNAGGSTGVNLGGIARQLQSGSGTTADKLALIQRQFLEHDDLGTFIDACLTSMDLLTEKRGRGDPVSVKLVEDAQTKTRDLLSYRSILEKDISKYNNEINYLESQLNILLATGQFEGKDLTPAEYERKRIEFESGIKAFKEDRAQTFDIIGQTSREIEDAKASEDALRNSLLAAQGDTPLSPLGRKCSEKFDPILDAVKARHGNIANIRKLELETEKVAKTAALEAAQTERLKEETNRDTARAALVVQQQTLEQTRTTTEILLSCRAFMQSQEPDKFPDAVKNYCSEALKKLTGS